MFRVRSAMSRAILLLLPRAATADDWTADKPRSGGLFDLGVGGIHLGP